ncbi:MAG TPA: glycoside hydrolase family 38 C-terminal domain-containing protein [Candidatus Brocadiia bacterium]|nr:glycoside hydrolase family 38 C-terminal domain-containing protein [Candidatus Brocadiia bacterium]
MKSRMAFAAVTAIVLSGTLAFAADTGAPDLEQVLRRLGSITQPEVAGWKFKAGDLPDAAKVDCDDSAWATATPEHTWGEERVCWYRTAIEIPERIAGARVAGGELRLKLSAGDSGELFVNGASSGNFVWDKGDFVLTKDAKPGDKFVLAIKVVRGVKPGRLKSARLHYSGAEVFIAAAAALRQDLLMAGPLIDAADDDAKEMLRTSLANALREVPFAAFEAGDEKALGKGMAKFCAALSPLQAEAKSYELHLIGHAHIDMNWLWRWPETKQVCHDTFSQALKFMDEWPEFHFSQSQCSTYRIMEEDWPDIFARIKERIQNGQWDVTAATWVEGDLNTADGEAICRQLLYAHRYSIGTLGVWGDVCWEPDTFGHPWTLPQFLRKAGIKYYYHTRCGPDVPLHYWESPDGSRVLVCKTGTYNGQVNEDTMRSPHQFKRACGARTAALVYGVGDHGGGPTRQDVETALEYRKRTLAPRVVFGSASGFFHRAEEAEPKLMTLRGEMNTIFEGCYTSHADIKRMNRRSEFELVTAETAAAMASLGGAPYPGKVFEESWRTTCFNQFHDIFCGCAIRGSYDYSIPLADGVRKKAREITDASLERLAAEADTRGEGLPIIVFNPLGWSRDAVVTATVNDADLPQEDGRCVIDSMGRLMPAETRAIGEGKSELLFLARDLPPVGCEVFHVLPGQAGAPMLKAQETGLMENDALRVKINPETGAISSLVLKATGREFAPQGRELAVLELLHELPTGMPAWMIGQFDRSEMLVSPKSSKLARSGPIECAWRSEYEWGKSKFAQEYILRAGAPGLDVRFFADWREIGNPQSGSWMVKAVFPTSLEFPAATFEIPCGHIRRPTNGLEVPALKWIDLGEPRSDELADRRKTVFTPVDLSGCLNAASFSNESNMGEADFDGNGMSYPSGMLQGAGSVTIAGVPFNLPALGGGRNDSVAFRGGTIPCPDGRYAVAYVLGASGCGSHAGDVGVDYGDGPAAAFLTLDDWCIPASGSHIGGINHPYRHANTGRTEPSCNLWVEAIPLDKGRTLKGFRLPANERMRIVAMTLADAPMMMASDAAVCGLSLLNDCKYGHDVRDNVMRLSLLRSSYSPDPEADVGLHEATYSLHPHDSGWREAGIVRRAYELNQPVLARVATAHPGPGGISRSMLRIQPDNLILTSVKRAEDSDDLILRFYESEGRKTSGYVAFRFGVEQIWQADLLERVTGDALPFRGTAVGVAIGPYEIKTLRLRLKH